MSRDFWLGTGTGGLAAWVVLLFVLCVNHRPQCSIVNTHDCELASLRLWNQQLQDQNNLHWKMWRERNLEKQP